MTIKNQDLLLPLSECGFQSPKPEQVEKLTSYLNAVIEKTKVMNLISKPSIREIIPRHLMDSLIVARHTEIPDSVLDIGSGGGFPGIPLSILLSEKIFHVCDRIQKKTRFLQETKDYLELSNVYVHTLDVRNSFPAQINGIITRGVEKIENTLIKAQNLLPSKGKVIFMKGPNVDLEIKEMKESFGFELRDHIEYQIPNTDFNRTLIIYIKS